MGTEKIWKPLSDVGESFLKEMAECFGVSPLIALLLHQSGVRTRDQASAFFNFSVEQLHDPFQMFGMERAVQRIELAREKGQYVRIYGDYDVDGTTSVALMFGFLQGYFNRIDYYIPDRETEGYGISEQGIEDAISKGVHLMIVLDCGINSVDLIRKAGDSGIDVVVCDHHLPAPLLPDAVAILNPRQLGCSYPFKELSACAIGWKLVQALCMRWGLPEEEYLRFLDLVAVSTSSDLVSMTGENRVLTALGLQRLEHKPGAGLRRIIDKFIRTEGDDLRIDVMQVVFMIGPRINAAGRLRDARVAVRLLLAEDVQEADALADELNRYNTQRKELDKVVTAAALAQIDQDKGYKDRFTTVVRGSDWHKGVVGIVASRLMEIHYRPTLVFTESDGKLVGSGRSIAGFDLHKALTRCQEHLLQFGGHAFAAGMKLLPQQFEAFRLAFEQAAQSELKKEDLQQVWYYNAEISLRMISEGLYKLVRRFAPFGPGHLEPMFLTREVWDSGALKTMGKSSEHLKLNLVSADREKAIGAVAFGFGHYYELLRSGCKFHVLYHIGFSDFGGVQSIQLMIKDMKPS